MSTPTHRSRARPDARNAGLPTWSGIAIVIAALITGLLLSINAQSIGTPYLICFGVAAVVVALFTEARGLFLVVASLPLVFGIMTVISAWAVTRSLAAEGSAAFSTTTVNPACTRRFTVRGVPATRRSLGVTSLGMPMRMANPGFR